MQHNLGHLMTLHSGDVPCPAELYLQQHGLNAGYPCLFQDFNVRDEVTPVNVEDVVEAALMEATKESLVVTIGDP